MGEWRGICAKVGYGAVERALMYDSLCTGKHKMTLPITYKLQIHYTRGGQSYALCSSTCDHDQSVVKWSS